MYAEGKSRFNKRIKAISEQREKVLVQTRSLVRGADGGAIGCV